MKKFLPALVAIFICSMIFTAMTTGSCKAESVMEQRTYLHWIWEDEHATMVNALLLTADEDISKHWEEYCKLYDQYAQLDPILKVYGVRKVCSRSLRDAMIVGLKANNLIYLIHTADENAVARKAAIKELRLLAQVINNKEVMEKFPYWADLLEEGNYPSRKLAHIYVHYTTDIGNYYYDTTGNHKRFFYWLGYLINDFTVAHLCDMMEWMQEDQKYLEQLYSIRQFLGIPRFSESKWDELNKADLSLKGKPEEVQEKLDYLKNKYVNSFVFG